MKLLYSPVIFAILLVITLASGCKKTPQPQCIITNPNNLESFAIGDTITVTAEILSYNEFIWSISLHVNNELKSTDFQPPYSFKLPTNDYLSGEYNLKVIVDKVSEISLSDEITIKLQALLPEARFLHITHDIHTPVTYHFYDNSTNIPTSWLWDFGDGTTSTKQNPFHTYNSPGSYSVSFTASNEAGTATIHEPYLIKTWSHCPETPAVIDIFDNQYPTVKIGDQCWMQENLRTPMYPNGEWIPYVNDSSEWAALSSADPAICIYDFPHGEQYGILYNYRAATADNWQNDNEEGQGICPDGWRLPTSEDYLIMQNYLLQQGYNWDRSTERNKLAISMASEEDWQHSIGEGTPGYLSESNNTSGFDMLPSGSRTSVAAFNNQFLYADLWTASLSGNDSLVHTIQIQYNKQELMNQTTKMCYGLPVRCIKR